MKTYSECRSTEDLQIGNYWRGNCWRYKSPSRCKDYVHTQAKVTGRDGNTWLWQNTVGGQK